MLAELEGRVDLGIAAPDRSDLDRLLSGADALLVRLFPVTRAILEKAPRLKVIGRHGVGVDSIDVEAATARRIPIVYTPNANSDAVAEHTILLMLAVGRRLVALDRAVRRNDWETPTAGLELRGRTVGIVGLGQVGRRVAHLCGSGFGMRVLGYDPFLPARKFPAGVGRMDPLEGLLSAADVVTLHVPMSATTHHLIDARRLRQMKRGAILVNTARGKLVDEAALHQALADGHLGGAGLDVLDEEPPRAGNALLALGDRVTLTPHAAGRSDVALQRMAAMLCSGVLAVLAGGRPRNVVNPQVWRGLEGTRVSRR